jgi:hypothetical protein
MNTRESFQTDVQDFLADFTSNLDESVRGHVARLVEYGEIEVALVEAAWAMWRSGRPASDREVRESWKYADGLVDPLHLPEGSGLRQKS